MNLGCAYWMYGSIENLCEEAGPWSCPTTTNSFSVLSLWGHVGSSRLIGNMGEYKQLKWLILAGIVSPIPFWLISKSSKSKKIQVRTALNLLQTGSAVHSYQLHEHLCNALITILRQLNLPLTLESGIASLLARLSTIELNSADISSQLSHR